MIKESIYWKRIHWQKSDQFVTNINPSDIIETQEILENYTIENAAQSLNLYQKYFSRLQTNLSTLKTHIPITIGIVL